MEDMNQRNWERLLLSTLSRVRGHLPGPGINEGDLNRMTTIERSKAELGLDIDEILEVAKSRGVWR